MKYQEPSLIFIIIICNYLSSVGWRSRIGQLHLCRGLRPKEGRRTYQPKCEHDNKDEDNCPKILNDKNMIPQFHT